MTRKDLLELQSYKSYPSITITLPTHRTFPESKQDPILLNDLVRQAKERLLGEFQESDVQDLLEKLSELTAHIDYQYNKEGLVLFASRELSRFYRLPFSVEPRVVVDQTFYTRHIAFALNRSQPYWLLALSEKITRLFHATRSELFEIIGGGFPVNYEGPGHTEPLPGGFGIEPSKRFEAYLERYFRDVDNAFDAHWKEDQIPLVIAGVEPNLAMFQQVSRHRAHILATLPGNYDGMPTPELGQKSWDVVKQAHEQRRRTYLKKLEDAVSGNYYNSTIGEAWRAVKEGRAMVLLVEKDFHQAGRLDDNGYLLYVSKDPEGPGVIEDAVDELIELMMAQGGDVVFVEVGDLKKHQGVAVINRY